MKKYFSILFMILVVGCKPHKTEKIGKPNVDTGQRGKTIIVIDSVGVHQFVYYDEGQYCLQTYVITELGQEHYRKGDEPNVIGAYEKFVPYNNTIAGSYKYIVEHKTEAYQKAEKWFYETYIAIPDSVKMLQSLAIGKIDKVLTGEKNQK